MDKIKGDGTGTGVVPPAHIPCGCHPYTSLAAAGESRETQA
jgi:hypothetical protein